MCSSGTDVGNPDNVEGGVRSPRADRWNLTADPRFRGPLMGLSKFKSATRSLP